MAKLGKAPGLGPGNCRFESCLSDHLFMRLFIKEREMFSLKKNFYLFVIALLLFACIGLYAYNLKLRGDIEELKDKNTYYENVINSLGSGELIEYPELYSEEYIEQINVHNCMWAIDMCSE